MYSDNIILSWKLLRLNICWILEIAFFTMQSFTLQIDIMELFYIIKIKDFRDSEYEEITEKLIETSNKS